MTYFNISWSLAQSQHAILVQNCLLNVPPLLISLLSLVVFIDLRVVALHSQKLYRPVYHRSLHGLSIDDVSVQLCYTDSICFSLY